MASRCRSRSDFVCSVQHILYLLRRDRWNELAGQRFALTFTLDGVFVAEVDHLTGEVELFFCQTAEEFVPHFVRFLEDVNNNMIE